MQVELKEDGQDELQVDVEVVINWPVRFNMERHWEEVADPGKQATSCLNYKVAEKY